MEKYRVTCLASVEMGQTVCSNKVEFRAEVCPCPRELGSVSRPRRRSPFCGFTSWKASLSPTCVTSTASVHRCSIAGRRSSSRTAPSRSSAPHPAPKRRQGSQDRAPRTEAPAQERSPLGTDGGTYQAKKRAWGTLNGTWVPQATRDSIVQFVRHWAGRTGLSVSLLVGWLGIAAASSTTGAVGWASQPAQRLSSS